MADQSGGRQVKNLSAQNFALVLIGGVALGLGLAFAKDVLQWFGDEP